MPTTILDHLKSRTATVEKRLLTRFPDHRFSVPDNLTTAQKLQLAEECRKIVAIARSGK